MQSIQTGSGTHPTTYSMDKGGSFPTDRAATGWKWPITTIQCNSKGFVKLYLPSPICLRDQLYTMHTMDTGILPNYDTATKFS